MLRFFKWSPLFASYIRFSLSLHFPFYSPNVFPLRSPQHYLAKKKYYEVAQYTKMFLKETGHESVSCIYLAQNGKYLQALVNMSLNI
jgi:hypothetical protein